MHRSSSCACPESDFVPERAPHRKQAHETVSLRLGVQVQAFVKFRLPRSIFGFLIASIAQKEKAKRTVLYFIAQDLCTAEAGASSFV